MIRVLMLSGSQRRHSLNERLLGEVMHRLPEHFAIDHVDPAGVDLPIFNQDLESVPEVVARVCALHERFAASHALVVASPEFNGLPTPYLKNIVDWVSRLPRVDAAFGNAFLDRPALLCSASTGWSGGSVAMPALRALFGYVGAMPFGETLCLPYAGQAWDEHGNLCDPDFGWQADALVDRFCAMVEKLSHPFPNIAIPHPIERAA